MFVVPAEFERDCGNLEGLAVRHSMTVALANYGGPTGDLAAGGGSAIWSDSGELLARLPAHGAGVAVATEERDDWHARTVTIVKPPRSDGD
jgi:predicted amidohydrolase